MDIQRTELLNRILDKYSAWYDVIRYEEAEAPLIAGAVFHEHETGFVLTRKAEMWSADRHEYAYFFTVPHLDAQTAEMCIARAVSLGENCIDPKPGHMCSVIEAVILCDSADEAAVRMIRKCRIRKSFHFSLWGWMEVHTAVVDVGTSSVSANGAGRNTAKFLNSLFHPVKERKKKIHIF